MAHTPHLIPPCPVFIIPAALIAISFCLCQPAYAEWRIDISEWAGFADYNYGSMLRGHFATKAECEKARFQLEKAAYDRSRCVGSDSPKQDGGGGGPAFGWGGGDISTDAGAKQFLLGGILSAILQGALSQPSQEVDTRTRQKLLWQQKQAAIKKEKARQAGLAEWRAFQDKAALQRAAEQHRKEQQGRNLLAELDRVGSSGKLGMEPVSVGGLDAFNRDNLDLPKDELQPIGTGRYDTSILSPLKRASCARYFSRAAADAANIGDDKKAVILTRQAQKVMAGRMTDYECRFPGLPDVPEAPKPVKVQTVSDRKAAAYYDGLIKTVRQDAVRLREVETELKETDRKIKQAKKKKQKAEQKVAEIQKTAAMARKPREKQEADDLLASARALLRESRDEVKAAVADRQALYKQKEEIITRLKDVQEKIQPKTETQ